MYEMPTLSLLESSHWSDYELLDSGDGLKHERFGPYTFVRPEVQAMWRRSSPERIGTRRMQYFNQPMKKAADIGC